MINSFALSAIHLCVHMKSSVVLLKIQEPITKHFAGDIVNTFNEGGLPQVTDWSGQGGGVKVSLSSTLTKPYQYMFHKVR